MKRASVLISGLMAAVALLGACSSEKPQSAASAAASPSASTSATAAPASPEPSDAATSSAQPSGRFCSEIDKFCITFASSGVVTNSNQSMETTAGPRTARTYGPDVTEWVAVYTPATSDPWKALTADRGWNFNPKRIDFKGHPALLCIGTQDNPTPGDPHRNVALKVFYAGKIYLVLIVAPEGEAQAKRVYDTLEFTK